VSSPESFLLDLSNGFRFVEFEWDDAMKRDALRILCRIARMYVDGEGQERITKVFGKKRLEFVVDGETYTGTPLVGGRD
jgi:hypothetical protein